MIVNGKDDAQEQITLQGGAGRGPGHRQAASSSQADGDVREVWLCSTGQDFVTISVMRDNYTWRQAFQQAIFGWNFHLLPGTDWHTIVRHLARALKVKAAALVLY